ncbi:molybdenum cofactor guanylyltransferase [Plantactinospora sonchi]|uniref:NTP transferase domain-containing protein n=1 Tax=Plantactinospora sonchi TaxID=1544735 RepID=A0ABU7RPH5_9ACTN
MTGPAGVSRFAAVVLTGGAGRRMGGVDKPALPVAGRSMRERVLAAVSDAEPRVVVGTTEGLPPGVHGVRERPAGGGPVAATAAGLALLIMAGTPDGSTATEEGAADDASTATEIDAVDGNAAVDAGTVTEMRAVDGSAADNAGTATEIGAVDGRGVATVALLAADLPLLTAAAVRELRTALERVPDADGVVYLDDAGRPQWLCGVWRVAPLRRALGRLAARRDGVLTGASVRTLMAELTVAELAWRGSGPPPWFDCDTDEDLRRAEEWIR